MIRFPILLSCFTCTALATAQPAVEHVVVPGLGRAAAFSHASISGDLIYVAGTLGTVGDTFDLISDDIAAQTRQTLTNIRKILNACGADFPDVMKVNVYLTDMANFNAMNEVYLEFFGPTPPARATVGVNQLALGALVEIECTARKPAPRVVARDVHRQAGFAESADARIYYESIGEGEPLVLSHGLGGNHAIWFQQVPVLAQKYRVITWDQRGFGRTESPEGTASPKSATADLAALLDHLSITKAHLVGQSMGGWAVIGFALAHPDHVLTLTLADTIGGIYTPSIEAHFDAYIRQAATAPRPDDLPIGQHPAVGAQFAAQDPARAFLYAQIGSVAAPAPANMGLLLRQTSYDISTIRTLKVPTLFIVGQNDPIFPPATIREAAAQIIGATVVEIPDTGHSPYFEAPDAWNAALDSFLDRH